MHLNNYNHKFLIEGTRLIFVQTASARREGVKLHENILSIWTPPQYFYHFAKGGHVSAIRAHLRNKFFVRLDLSKFFDCINRSRVHRALRRIGFSHRRAWDAACHSTVNKEAKKTNYSLPFGFVQSPVLASLAFASSSLGVKIMELHRLGIDVSVYMDDILLSGNNSADLYLARRQLEAAAEISRFTFNSIKSTGPKPEIEVFNIIVSYNTSKISPDRYKKFEEEVKIAKLAGRVDVVRGILGYVGTINENQCLALGII